MSGAADCDVVVVGSGAGGGTLAARLAEGGLRVILLEAGGDPRAAAPAVYDVPAFHAVASEHPDLAWNFWVRHYADAARQARDPKARPEGVLYPRSGTLGGCTAHNAMILMRPPDADWDAIAALTGDASWSASAMQGHWERLEQCRHRPAQKLLAAAGIDPSGHGFAGWLPAERAMPLAAFADDELVHAALESAGRLAFGGRHWPGALAERLEAAGDPNDRRGLGTHAGGLCYLPLTTDGHARFGTRERLLDVAARYPERLRIETDALATRVILDGANRARGVEYQSGARLYRACPQPAAEPGATRQVTAAREVVLAGGAFNTPQLLMLSGIGDADALARHGIAARIDNKAIGRNLQDRYEISVVNRMPRPWSSLAGAAFSPADPLYAQWAAGRTGMYVSNGGMLAARWPSAATATTPDLFCMALLARFAGYAPGYAMRLLEGGDGLSWVVLKGYTRNRAGTVRLRSADPRDMPLIDFHYFEESGAGADEDMAAMVAGVRRVRGLVEGLGVEELLPGPAVQSDADIAAFVRDHAWGHHASCSCAMPDVLDSQLRVLGTTGLRVVDASVFPRIPGLFIAAAVYLAAEKAAADMLA